MLQKYLSKTMLKSIHFYSSIGIEWKLFLVKVILILIQAVLNHRSDVKSNHWKAKNN